MSQICHAAGLTGSLVAITIDPRLNPRAVSLALLLAGGAAALAVWPGGERTPAPVSVPMPPPQPVAAPPSPLPAAPSLTPADVAEVRVHGTLGNAAIVSIGSAAQQRIIAGRQILPGITLESTAPGHVIVARGGTRLRIPLLSFDGTPPPATDVAADGEAPAPTKATAEIPTLSRAAYGGDNARRQTLAFQLGLVREAAGEVTRGFRVRKIADMAFFRRAGLRDGDIVTAINGAGLHSEEKIIELADELAQSKRVTISYLRGDAPHEAEVDFTN